MWSQWECSCEVNESVSGTVRGVSVCVQLASSPDHGVPVQRSSARPHRCWAWTHPCPAGCASTRQQTHKKTGKHPLQEEMQHRHTRKCHFCHRWVLLWHHHPQEKAALPEDWQTEEMLNLLCSLFLLGVSRKIQDPDFVCERDEARWLQVQTEVVKS